MITLYLRYRNYSRQRLEEMINPVLENLISRRVITEKDSNNKKNNSGSNFDLNSFELTYPLSRLQCSVCFYISYLSTAEPRSCLRCSSINLHDFPAAQAKKGPIQNKQPDKKSILNMIQLYMLGYFISYRRSGVKYFANRSAN